MRAEQSFQRQQRLGQIGRVRTVTTLRRKRDEIVSAIKLYERQLDQAKADLGHVVAATDTNPGRSLLGGGEYIGGKQRPDTVDFRDGMSAIRTGAGK
jgi:hypothetical protein